MDLQLTNKKALVTGSTAGIGFAIASLLAQAGASVIVNGRSQPRVEEAVQRIRNEKKGVQVTGVVSVSTIHAEIEEATVRGRTVETSDGKITRA